MAIANPFERGAYSSVSRAYSPVKNNYSLTDFADQTFSGHDLQVYFNDIKVGNLESVSWTTSTETVSNHVMGRRDPVAFTQGKRVIVGSIVMQKFARDALLQQVFQFHRRNIGTIGDLWTIGQAVNGLNLAGNGTINTAQVVNGSSTLASSSGASGTVVTNVDANTFSGLTNFRGLSPAELAQQVNDQIRDAANFTKNLIVKYPDQLPPFNITLVGVNKSGAAARCMLYGVQITQETDGFSQQDLGSSTGFAFVCLSKDPWTAIETNN